MLQLMCWLYLAFEEPDTVSRNGLVLAGFVMGTAITLVLCGKAYLNM